MDIDIKTTLRSSCRALLRPIASIVLKCGMTWREFSELSKSVFVSVATDEFGIRGRPTNVSRVSILTGISRKEVKRQRELLAEPEIGISPKTTDASRLLSGWYQHPDYVDAEGRPLALPGGGPKPSFHSLFEHFGGDTPQQTLVRELLKAGSIEENEQGQYVAKRRYHMPVEMDPGSIRVFGTNLFDHANTLCKNITSRTEDRWLEGFAIDDQIHPDAIEDFRDFLDKRGQHFLEEIDDWLSQHRLDSNESGTTPVRLGLGVYAIEGQLPKGT
ncbi:MAG: DUF6502 family protein [Woeseiaceae bacterium]